MTAINELGYLVKPVEYTALKSMDGAGLLDAIAKLPSTGGPIYLPPGRITLSAAVVISKSNVSFIGASQVATNVVFTHNGAAFQITGTDVTLSNLQVFGPSMVTAPLSIAFECKAIGADVHDVTVWGCAIGIKNSSIGLSAARVSMLPGAGTPCGSLLVSGASTGDVGCYIEDSEIQQAQAEGFWIKQSTASSTQLVNCRTRFQSFGGTPKASFKLGSDEHKLDDVSLVGCATPAATGAGLEIAPLVGQTLGGAIVVTGCTFSGERGIDINMASMAAPNVVISGCSIHSTSSNAFRIQNVNPGTAAAGVVMSGCRTASSCTLGASLTLVHHCAFTGNAFYTAAAQFLATIAAGNNTNAFVGNVFKGAVVDSGTNNIGIALLSNVVV
jgi:hypothetical protein